MLLQPNVRVEVMWRALLVAVMFPVGLLAFPGVTSAADSIVTDPSAIVIAAPLLTLLVSLLIPLANGLLTSIKMPGAVKGVLTIVLNAVWSLIATATTADGVAVFSRTTLYTAVLGTIVSVVSYFNLWKPMKLSSSVPDSPLAGGGLG